MSEAGILAAFKTLGFLLRRHRCRCGTLRVGRFTPSYAPACNINPHTKGVSHMHAAAINLRGGVSPRNTRLRGQSIIEYVLIAAVIGLVVIFAGPQVSSAIRNQFNQVTNTVDSGTDGDNFISAEEKAYREAMKTVASKEAKDWTLDEQKAAAADIAKNGTSSVVYAKAKAAMDAGIKFSIKLTNGKTLEYRIVGINHDDLADGSGKAGLTFETTNDAMGMTRMNVTHDNADGWEKSELRGRLNSGDLWSLLPSDFQSRVKAVAKLTDNKGSGSVGTPSATTDKVFLLSSTEVWGDLDKDGTQYEYYQSKGVTELSNSEASLGFNHWTRSVDPSNSMMFRCVNFSGRRGYGYAANANYVSPALCF